MGNSAYDKFWRMMGAASESKTLTPEEQKQLLDTLEREKRERAATFNIFDSLYHKMKGLIGTKVPNLEALKTSLEKGKHHTERAQKLINFIKDKPDLPEQLIAASENIGKVTECVNTIGTRVEDLSAASDIFEAVTELNKWAAAGANGNNVDAGKAFDKLFGGVANYADKLPLPYKLCSKFLKQICISKFFENMAEIGATRVGESTKTPYGKQMKEVLATIDAQGHGG